MTRRMHRRDIVLIDHARGGTLALDWQSLADASGQGRLRPSLALVLLPWIALLCAMISTSKKE